MASKYKQVEHFTMEQVSVSIFAKVAGIEGAKNIAVIVNPDREYFFQEMDTPTQILSDFIRAEIKQGDYRKS